MIDKVNLYYRTHLPELPFTKQFHFASRLWLWSQDKEMAQFLRASRRLFCGDGSAEGAKQVLSDLAADRSDSFGTKNAAHLRAPYFAKYPQLKRALPLLFRLLFMETVYGYDGREHLAEVITLNELEKLQQDLLQDPAAIAVLSTHAANFLYLWNRFYHRSEDGVPVERLFEIGRRQYDLADRTQLQLFIYLYTHCIIGESLFYKRGIPAAKADTYKAMAESLDDVLAVRYADINLDNKFETLVCRAICRLAMPLKPMIYEEALVSFAEGGDYVIDRRNRNPQSDNVTLEKSEHRNVLLILSSLPFHPGPETL